MQEKQRKLKEIAIIFAKTKDKNGIIYYNPIKVKIGHLDKENNIFITKKESFHYLSDTNHEYGFGLRTTLKEFKKDLGLTKETLREDIHYYLESLQEYTYFFSATDKQNFSDLTFMAQEKLFGHKFNNVYYILPDTDIEIGKQILTEKAKTNYDNSKKTLPLTFDAKKLSDEIKKTVIGQDTQIDDIITILWQNYRSQTKNNILLIGPTGVGKTEIIRNISKKLDIPMATINVTDTSQSAYLGTNLSEVITKLVKSANNNIEKASNGIIFIDEIDKKANSGEFNTGIMTTGIQDELLKLLEDNDYQVNISDNPTIPEIATINTKNITFICAGAFSKMDEIKKTKKSIGFGITQEQSPKVKEDIITPEDLVKYGLKPELIGRLHNIIQLSALTKDNLIKIMKNPNNQTIQEKINILTSLGIKLTLDECVYDLIAENALKKKTGARGLVGEVDKLFLKAMTEISRSEHAFSELTIDQETIKDNNSYKLIRKK